MCIKNRRIYYTLCIIFILSRVCHTYQAATYNEPAHPTASLTKWKRNILIGSVAFISSSAAAYLLYKYKRSNKSKLESTSSTSTKLKLLPSVENRGVPVKKTDHKRLYFKKFEEQCYNNNARMGGQKSLDEELKKRKNQYSINQLKIEEYQDKFTMERILYLKQPEEIYPKLYLTREQIAIEHVVDKNNNKNRMINLFSIHGVEHYVGKIYNEKAIEKTIFRLIAQYLNITPNHTYQTIIATYKESPLDTPLEEVCNRKYQKYILFFNQKYLFRYNPKDDYILSLSSKKECLRDHPKHTYTCYLGLTNVLVRVVKKQDDLKQSTSEELYSTCLIVPPNLTNVDNNQYGVQVLPLTTSKGDKGISQSCSSIHEDSEKETFYACFFNPIFYNKSRMLCVDVSKYQLGQDSITRNAGYVFLIETNVYRTLSYWIDIA